MEHFSKERHQMLTQISKSFGEMHSDKSLDDWTTGLELSKLYAYKPTRFKAPESLVIKLKLTEVFSQPTVFITGLSPELQRVKTFGFKFQFIINDYLPEFEILCCLHNEDKYIYLSGLGDDPLGYEYELITRRTIADVANTILTKHKKLLALYNFITD